MVFVCVRVCVCVCVCVLGGLHRKWEDDFKSSISITHTHTEQRPVIYQQSPASTIRLNSVCGFLSSSPLFVSSPRLLSSSPLPSLYCPSLIFRCTALLSHVFAVSCLVEAEDVLFLRSVFTGRKHDISLPNSRENLRAQKHIRVETDESFSDIQQICVCRPTVIPLCPLLLIPAPWLTQHNFVPVKH